PDIAPKLNRVLPDCFRKIISPLKRIACLGQLPLEVVSNCKAPRDVHIRNPHAVGDICREPRWRMGKYKMIQVLKAFRSRNKCSAGIMQARQNMSGMIQGAL